MTNTKELRRLAMDVEAQRPATNQEWSDISKSRLAERFVAAASPSVVLALLDENDRLNAENLALHRELAGETLRADQGWQRYEAANKRANAAEQALERSQLDTPTAFAMLPACTCFTETQEKYCIRLRKCSKAVAYGLASPQPEKEEE